jgi:hypothetical protein
LTLALTLLNFSNRFHKLLVAVLLQSPRKGIALSQQVVNVLPKLLESLANYHFCVPSAERFASANASVDASHFLESLYGVSGSSANFLDFPHAFHHVDSFRC